MMLVVLGNNLSTRFRDHFNARARDPAGGIEIIPASIGLFNGDRPRGAEVNREAFAEFWYRQPPQPEKVRGRHVYYVQSLGGDTGQRVMEAMAVASTLKGQLQAASVTGVFSYVPFPRQERIGDDGRITAVMGEIFPQILHGTFRREGEDVHFFDRIITTDLHCEKSERHYVDTFGGGNVLFIPSMDILADELKKNRALPVADTVICTPDGWDKRETDAGQRRAREFLSRFHSLALPLTPEQESLHLAGLVKKRELTEKAGISEVRVKFAFGNVAGKKIIMVDDIGDSLRTVLRASKELLDHGAGEITLALTSQGGDEDRLETVLKETHNGRRVIDRIVFTDAIPAIEEHIDLLADRKHEDKTPKYPDIRQRVSYVTTAPAFEQAMIKFTL